jgi:hypothetical protein
MEIYELCNRYRCLPEAGGLFDQDAELLDKFKILDKIMVKKAEIDKRNEEMRKPKTPQVGPLF